MPRICILTQYFPPEMGAPQVRLSELGEGLIERGWEVEALTALPNYPTGKIFDGYGPGKTIVENVGRIRTIRVPLKPSKSGFLKRLYCYGTFIRSAMKHGPHHCETPDLLFVESPPLFIGYAAKSLSKKWNCPYIFNVSDLWPESAIRMGVVKPGFLTYMASRLEKKCYKNAIAVTGQSSEIIEGVLSVAPETKTEVITNGCTPEKFGKSQIAEEHKTMIGEEPGPVFVYAGLMGYAQGLDQILDLAKSIPSSQPGRIVMIGDGPVKEQLQQRINDEKIDRVKLIPAQAREMIPGFLALADASIISLGMQIPGAVPSKIYEAMASSLPILMIAEGEAAKRVEDAKCGLTAKPGDFDSVKEAFNQLVSDSELREKLGLAGRQAAETKYNRSVIADKLDQFLRELLPE